MILSDNLETRKKAIGFHYSNKPATELDKSTQEI